MQKPEDIMKEFALAIGLELGVSPDKILPTIIAFNKKKEAELLPEIEKNHQKIISDTRKKLNQAGMVQHTGYKIVTRSMRDSKGITAIWVLMQSEENYVTKETKWFDVSYSPLYVTDDDAIKAAQKHGKFLGVEVILPEDKTVPPVIPQKKPNPFTLVQQ